MDIPFQIDKTSISGPASTFFNPSISSNSLPNLTIGHSLSQKTGTKYLQYTIHSCTQVMHHVDNQNINMLLRMFVFIAIYRLMHTIYIYMFKLTL